jgi:predicted DsbA family dithiol-disulfide isomerase
MNTFKVVSDLICPWCYIGKRRLEAALRQLPKGTAVEVSWHPFQLNPEMPRRGMDRKEYCQRKFGSWEKCQQMFTEISSVGKTVGIEFHFEKQPTIPNTLEAHRVIWLAGREGCQGAVMEALFRAYFCDGVNLSNRGGLLEVSTNAGLDRKLVDRLLNSDEGVAEVWAEEKEVKSLGISSVPLFIIQETLAVSGAQPPEAILKAFEQAQASRGKQEMLGQDAERQKTRGPRKPQPH